MVIGAMITSFGIYQIHDVSDITEGGILGLDLLLNYWFHISPAVGNFVMTAVCFAIGWKALGKSFVVYSAIATGSFSLFYRIWEHTPRLFPQIAGYPLLAALAGALFVGVGVGLSVSRGGAQSGDDALAMAFSHYWGWKVSKVYLVSDLTVLLLSLSYIPWQKIVYSLVTVVLSGQIIELTVLLYQKRQKRKDVMQKTEIV